MGTAGTAGAVATSQRVALRLLQFGALAVVLVSAPYKTFDLDRFFVPKELVFNACALFVTLLCLIRVKRVALARVDQLLALWLLLGAASAVFATNWWLAERAVAISFAGAACFWCARSLSRAGLAKPLVAALALAGVVGAATALLQAYGIRTELFSLNRAPGGTFGNRNFMAHLCAITLPALLFSGLRAPTRAALLRWCAGIAIVAAALILSRSRAAWLAIVAGLVVFLVATFFAMRTRDGSFKLRRLLVLGLAAAAGAGASLVLPNTLDWKSDSPYLDTAHSLVNYKGGSGKGRLVQYGNSLKMSLRHPLLGVGPGNWPVIYPKFASDEDPSLGQDGMTSNPWPSSDWVTFIAERGAVALGILVLAVLALGMDALRELRAGPDEDARVSSAALAGTLAAVVVVGSFDAVLLLPMAALVGWALLGALSARSRERSLVEVPWPLRGLALILVAALGGLAVARSGTQLAAMSLYSGSSRAAALERASSLDPGSYRIHVKLAEAYKNRGDCTRARTHATAARQLFPSAPAPRRILASCGG
ncbi:MAG: O-antigen ligase family protein [bacterium]